MSVISVRKKELKKRGYSDFNDWNSQPHTLYIGRNMEYRVPGTKKSIWANPYRGPDAGKRFEAHVQRNLIDRLFELQGKELGCWCAPKPCHGHVLIRLLKQQRLVKAQDLTLIKKLK